MVRATATVSQFLARLPLVKLRLVGNPQTGPSVGPRIVGVKSPCVRQSGLSGRVPVRVRLGLFTLAIAPAARTSWESDWIVCQRKITVPGL
jgi:hypothetical protein